MNQEHEVYFDQWDSYEDMMKDWDNGHWDYEKKEYVHAPAEGLIPAPDEVLFAEYTYEDYSGGATVIFKKDGKLYEVDGSHCSCFGLEGQWEPDETTVAALAMRAEHERPEFKAMLDRL